MDSFYHRSISPAHEHLLKSYQSLPKEQRHGALGAQFLTLLTSAPLTEAQAIPHVLEALFQGACTMDDPHLLAYTFEQARVHQSALKDYFMQHSPDTFSDGAFLYATHLIDKPLSWRYAHECAPYEPLNPNDFESVQRAISDQWSHLCSQGQDSLLPYLGYAMDQRAHRCVAYLLQQPSTQQHYQQYHHLLEQHFIRLTHRPEQDDPVDLTHLPQVLSQLFPADAPEDDSAQLLRVLLQTFGIGSVKNTQQLHQLYVQHHPVCQYASAQKYYDNTRSLPSASEEHTVYAQNVQTLLQWSAPEHTQSSTFNAPGAPSDHTHFYPTLIYTLLVHSFSNQTLPLSSASDAVAEDPYNVHFNTPMGIAIQALHGTSAALQQALQAPQALGFDPLHGALLEAAVKSLPHYTDAGSAFYSPLKPQHPYLGTLNTLAHTLGTLCAPTNAPPELTIPERLQQLVQQSQNGGPKNISASALFEHLFVSKNPPTDPVRLTDSLIDRIFTQLYQDLNISPTQSDSPKPNERFYFPSARGTLGALGALVQLPSHASTPLHAFFAPAHTAQLQSIHERLLALQLHYEQSLLVRPISKELQSQAKHFTDTMEQVFDTLNQRLKPEQQRRPSVRI